MTEITPFPENNYETVLLDRPFRVVFVVLSQVGTDYCISGRWLTV